MEHALTLLAFLMSALAPPNASPTVLVPIRMFSASPVVGIVDISYVDSLLYMVKETVLTMLGWDDQLHAEISAHDSRSVSAHFADWSEDGDAFVVLIPVGR